MKGLDCFFRHDTKTFKMNHRHYYMPQMFKYETQYHTAPDKDQYLENYVNVTERLPFFQSIHGGSRMTTEEETLNEKAWGFVKEIPKEYDQKSEDDSYLHDE